MRVQRIFYQNENDTTDSKMRFLIDQQIIIIVNEER